jgi:glutaminyl-peptide cyclotransferase
MKARNIFLIVVACVLIIAGVVALVFANRPLHFSGESALSFIARQMDAGPRTPGSQAHQIIMQWIADQLQLYGWQVEIQDTVYQGQNIQNIIAKRGTSGNWTILGAHYDCRLVADHDPDPSRQADPVPGANDSASGVAVLLEIARVYRPAPGQQVWLVFFDAEDQGRLAGWDWILGSRAFVDELSSTPDQVIILDMVGDADQNFYFEANSDPRLSAEIWQNAADLGYGDQFLAEQKHSILDDHTPFLAKGMTAIDIIDFEYEYWHTTADTLDKVSAESLQRIGNTVLAWLASQK